MSAGPSRVKKITQFSRQAHWLSERPNPEYSSGFQFLMRWLPGAQLLYRVSLFLTQEKDFAGFKTERGESLRNNWTSVTTDYIRKNSPAKYRDFLVPKTVIGCKRRVMDTNYLTCLHRDNVELVHDDPIDHVTERGIVTKSGREIYADAIVLANGFETQKPLFPMEIRGESGQTISDHVSAYLEPKFDVALTSEQWQEFADGSPEAYFGTCLSGFPNFFVLMGPNTLSGHLSVLYTTECQINFVIRVIRPILMANIRSWVPSLFRSKDPQSVAVTPIAERRDLDMVNERAKKLVWATGCSSWFIDSNTGRNTIMFPDWQFKFHLRSIFIPWRDLVYRQAPMKSPKEVELGVITPFLFASVGITALGGLLGASLIGGFEFPSKVSHLPGFLRRIYWLEK
ncbi:hypothetical protein N7533_013323 [Penicillium manginii]|uniref:uncharacterized protein n=1 Tax=Penicillium manginii TaxID=203109 RepID=UPI00254930B5|nr:uncharacterized protein N7533_013323 [Penicillium manginii]KAJ5732876.1 hypothetical protein N7533_013323 [Penicillium manginii]